MTQPEGGEGSEFQSLFHPLPKLTEESSTFPYLKRYEKGIFVTEEVAKRKGNLDGTSLLEGRCNSPQGGFRPLRSEMGEGSRMEGDGRGERE